VYVKPDGAVGADEVDALHEKLESFYASEVAPARTAVIVTEHRPFE